MPRNRNPVTALANRIGISEKTLRACFDNKPVTWRTAHRIARILEIDIREIVIKSDARGLAKRRKKSTQDIQTTGPEKVHK